MTQAAGCKRSTDGLRVLVTGALGAIGNAVSTTLVQSRMTVVGMDSSPNGLGGSSLFSKFIVADVRDREAVEAAVSEVDAVAHLAAWVHRVPHNKEEETAIYEVNQLATERICNICKQQSKRIVLASTVAVYGEDTMGEFNEGSPLCPETPYAKSKLEAEEAVIGAGGIVLRLPMVYGRNDRGNMYRMIHAISRGWFVVPGSGAAKRTFVGRWNVAQAFFLALTIVDPMNYLYLVTDDETVTVGEMADLIAKISGSRSPRKVPRFLLGFAAVGGTVLGAVMRHKMPLDYSMYKKLNRDLIFDGSRIRLELGYSPVRRLAEGLKEEIDWYLMSRT